MTNDIYGSLPFGQAALKKMIVPNGNFRIYVAELLDPNNPRRSRRMKVSGAVFREAKRGPNKGKLVMMVPGSIQTAIVTAAEIMEETFYLQDSRTNLGSHMSFWAAGYSTNLNQARTFTWQSALKHHKARPTDIPWPAKYVHEHSRPVVDFQYLGGAHRADKTTVGKICLQHKPSRYDGNDLMFLKADQLTTSSNLDEAGQFSYSEAQAICGNHAEGAFVMWPHAYLKTKSRPAADARTMDCKVALGLERFAQLQFETEEPMYERQR